MTMTNDFLAGYIAEVRDYIPTLKKGVADLRVSPDRRDVLEEMYRLVHIIKGASSMVGIAGLSQIAGIMETRLEAILEGGGTLTGQTIEAMNSTVARIAQYCEALGNNTDIAEQELIEQTEQAFAGSQSHGSQGQAEQGTPDLGQVGGEEDSLTLEQELLQEFRAEADEHFTAIQRLMQRLTAAVEDLTPLDEPIREDVRQIRRSVHTIKGASAVIGMAEIAAYGHRVEAILDWLYEEAGALRPAVVQDLQSAVEQLAFLVETPGRFDSGLADEAINRLQGYMKETALAGTGGGTAPEVMGSSTQRVATSRGKVAAPAPQADAGSLASDLFSDEDRQILLEGFREEAEEHLEQIHRSMQVLESGISQAGAITEQQREEVRRIRRAVHTIKGASAVIGLSGIASYTHGVEDFLDWFYEQATTSDPDMVNRLAEALDLVGHLVEGTSTVTQAQQQGALQHLQAYCAQVTPHPEPSEEGEDLAIALDLDAKEDTRQDESVDAGSLASDLFSDEDRQILLEGFREEAEEHLEQMHRSMQVLESEISQTGAITERQREEVRRIRRAVHTIKGASAVVGLREIATYAHGVEDFLDWFYEQAADTDPDMVNRLAESLDLVGQLVEGATVSQERRDQAQSDLLAFLDSSDSEPLAPEKPAPAPAQEPREGSGSVGTGSLASDLFSDEDRQMLLAGFQEEAEEHLQQIHQSLQALESSIVAETEIDEEHREEIRRIRRAVHTIKGASAVVGLTEVSGYSHEVENFLDWFYEQAVDTDPDMINRLAEALDLVGQLVEDPLGVSVDRRDTVLGHLMPFFADAEDGEVFWDEDILEDTQSELSSEPTPPQDIFDQTASPPPWEQGDEAGAVPEAAKTLRVSQQQVDTLVNLANELLVGISGFDRDMDKFQDALSELELATNRIKDIALELETTFEVKALKDLGQRFNRVEKAIADLKGQEQFADFDAMELDRYSQLNLIIRSLNESAIDVSAIQSNLGTVHSAIGGDINRQRRVTRELQIQLLRARMSPMSSITSRLSRTMRDVAGRLGKRVRLQVEGDGVELDRVVWEKLADPFMHLMRNAVHHGIENEETRKARGKAPIATITLSGHRVGNSIMIRFGDDGQGLDFEAIRAKARRLGIGAQAEQMDRHQLTDLIFYPGFSTKTISEISGRGVGMDVVREHIKELQGSIKVESEDGKGTTFVLRIPLTMGVVRCLLVQSGSVNYGLPLSDIKEIRRVESATIDRKTGVMEGEGGAWSCHSLEVLLGAEDTSLEHERSVALVVESEGHETMVTIPRISGQNELVIKGLGSHLRSVSGISGAAVLGDGSIVPVLNVGELIQTSQMGEQVRRVRARLEQPKVFTVMIVDDSISIRRVMSRLVTAQGWNPVEARDGMEALDLLDTAEPDCVILDVEMPRMNGFEFLMKLNNLPGRADLPVIMLTSRTSTKHREKAFSLGAKGFLNKPCRDEDFVQTVQLVTGGAVLRVPGTGTEGN